MDRFEEVKSQIKERTELVPIVEEYVPLRSRGRYHVGLCPFHQEKTPSFTVYSDTEHYHCYGCGAAGDVFAFLMQRDGLSFREALETLADRLGISTEGVFGRGRGDGKPRVDVHKPLLAVREWFREQLVDTMAGERAREYVAARGLDAAIEGFGLGFHPTGGKLVQFAEKHGLPRELLEIAGLLGDDGYERFAGRLMFPIEDERGRTVGFGGRILDSQVERAKYLNSPESPFFNKRKLLFGLQQAKKSGVRRLVVMEGYTDVIAAHLAGFSGAVATLGTALTTDHARLLERYATDGVVLLFDGDRAGRQAADRAFRELVHTRLPVSIALLDEGTDPADLVSAVPGRDEEAVAKGRDLLAEIVASADDALTAWFRLHNRETSLSLDVHVERLAAECGRILKSVADPVRRTALGQGMARHLGVPEPAFRQLVAKSKPIRRPAEVRSESAEAAPAAQMGAQAGGEGAVRPDENPDDPWSQAAPRSGGGGGKGAPAAAEEPLAATDLDLLACLIAAPEHVDDIGDVEVKLSGVAEILGLFRTGFEQGSRSKDEIVGYLFMECAERPELRQLLASCHDRSTHIKSPKETFSLLLKDRSAHQSRHAAQNLRIRLQQAKARGDQAAVAALQQEYLQQLRSRSHRSG